jgi:ATP-dependent DNA helicase RecG
MTDVQKIRDALSLGEGFDVEFKLGLGEDGRGKLPKSFWETYSAMANTDGGAIVIGVREDYGTFEPVGVPEPQRVQTEIFDGANNREIVNRNILTSSDASVKSVDGKQLLIVTIPRAKRPERPVFVGKDFMRGTYRRNFRGDYLCDEPTVKRMLAEALEESRDTQVLPAYSASDLDPETIARYRAELQRFKPEHPFLAASGDDFLRELGAIGKDRENGREGLTIAGLLMFGRLRTITEIYQFYFLDYQERSGEGSAADITFRITTDGSWSGNLFDFYLRTIPRLTRDVHIPVSRGGTGKGNPADKVREALSEALVNTLIHADYSCRTPVLVTRREGTYVFRNPGSPRVSIRLMLAGGNTDCRNRTLQKFFLMIGVAEHAGSGVLKIVRAWKAQGWRAPLIRERNLPEETIVRLPLSSMIPAEVTERLRIGFGEKFDNLDATERAILGTAEMEAVVSNSRVRDLNLRIHRVEITGLLKSLVDRGFLVQHGATRGTFYELNLPSPPASDLQEGAGESPSDSPPEGEDRDIGPDSDGNPTAG